MRRACASSHVYSTSMDTILDTCRPFLNKTIDGILKIGAVCAAQDISIKESVTKEHALCKSGKKNIPIPYSSVEALTKSYSSKRRQGQGSHVSFNNKKLEPADSGLHKAALKSDRVLLSAGEPRNSGFILGLRYVSASQISLLWRTPRTWTTFARGYGSFNKSRKQELGVSDEDENEDENDFEDEDRVEDRGYEVLDEQRISDSDSDDYEVLDEQHIEDDDDYHDDVEEEEEEGSQNMQNQVPVKKKFEIQPPKPKVVDEGPILNEKITARTLRLVDDDGRGHKIVLRDEALFLAKKKQMDLVLMDGKRDPPVCKIFNFHREQYKREQKSKERKKNKGAAAKLNEIKELRYNAKTEPKDLKMKVQKAKKFLERGYKVKFVANFIGHIEEEEDRRERGKMIDKIISMMDEIAVIEQGPRVESRLVWVLFRHMKFGKVKKKPPKPAVQIDANVEEENGKPEGLVHHEYHQKAASSGV